MTELKQTQNLPVIIIVGATASGKTSVAVELAKLIDAEIVSADSRQVYRYLDVGTAKPNEEERNGIPHHGFDLVDPNEVYSAGRFANDAREWISEIQNRGKNVIVAGGSGLYLQALVHGFFDGDVKNRTVRKKLENRLQSKGLDVLYKELIKLDPEYAAKTLPGDRQRILRALEVIKASGGIKFSELQHRERVSAVFPTRWFGLKWKREELYKRIDQRVDMMFNHGLFAEVKSLLDRGYRNAYALKSVGYEEIVDFREGILPDMKTARSLIKRNTRHYAKRQLTWFRKDEQIEWIDVEEKKSIEIAEQILNKC